MTFHNENLTYLWVAKIEHVSNCGFEDKIGLKTEEEEIFEDPTLRALISSTLPPKNVIKKTYNKQRKEKGLSELKDDKKTTA